MQTLAKGDADWKFGCLKQREAWSVGGLAGRHEWDETSRHLPDSGTCSISMSETITQLGTLLLPAIPTAALFAAVWIGYRLNLHKLRQSSGEARRRLAAIESTLGNLQSKVAAIDRESIEKRVRATVEAEKVKIVEAAEREILAGVSAITPDFRAYATDMAVALAANGLRVDGWTDEALLRSIIDQLGLRGRN